MNSVGPGNARVIVGSHAAVGWNVEKRLDLLMAEVTDLMSTAGWTDRTGPDRRFCALRPPRPRRALRPSRPLEREPVVSSQPRRAAQPTRTCRCHAMAPSISTRISSHMHGRGPAG